MKKIVSMLLVVMMIISIVPAVAMAEETSSFTDVKGTEYYASSAEVLAQLGVLTGYEDGTFGAEKSITRAEMATIICRMLDKAEDADKAKGETKFDDVKSEHWASGFVNVANKEGIINGYLDNTFKPENEVLFEEAVKMVVCALDLDEDVTVDPSDWSKAYLDKAKASGITANLKGEKGMAATRGDVAVMVKQALSYDLVAPVASVTAGTYTSTQKVTLTTSTKDAEIYYTTDGSEPTVKSTKYEKEISISKTATLKAVTIKKGVLVSDILAVEYVINKASSGGGGGGGGGSTKTYTVTFDLNYNELADEDATDIEDATDVEEPSETETEDTYVPNVYKTVKVKSGKKVAEPEVPEREGFVFIGWALDVIGEEMFDFSTKIKGNIILYAIWDEEIDECTVTFNLNYEDAPEAPATQKFEINGLAVEPEAPVRDGYVFLGWSTDENGTEMFNFNTFVTEDITLYAKWAVRNGDNPVSVDDVDPDVEIYSFNTDTYDILIGESAVVTFTAEIFANIELSNTDVVVIDEEQIELGYMNDDGVAGDEEAGDGIWTLSVEMIANEFRNTKYSVLAKDVLSDNSINICFYREFTDEEFDQVEEIKQGLNQITEIYVNEDGYVQASDVENILASIELYLDEKLENGEIIRYTIEDTFVWVDVIEGYSFAYELNIEGFSAGGNDVFIASYAPYDGTRGRMEALYDEALDGTSENIETVFDNYIFNDESNFDLNEVTLDNLKNMSDYKVILWGGHGGYDSRSGGNGSRLRTGELYNRETSRAYSADISSGCVIDTGSAGNRGTYAVTGGFFDKYLGNMDGAFVYLSACHSGQDMIDGVNHRYQLVQSFLNKGATAVVGNSESIYSTYTYSMQRDIVNRMCEENGSEGYYTLSQALSYAKSRNGNDDGSPEAARPLIFPLNDQDALNYVFDTIDKGYIAGSVKDAETEASISNALVRVYKDGRRFKSVRTDSDGYYEIEVPEGEYIVKITKGSYKSAKIAVTVVADSTTYNETMLLINIGIEVGYANGIISSAVSGMGVEGVTLKLRSGWNNLYGNVVITTQTNENGYYSVNGTPGIYTMEYSKTGYITGYKNIVLGVIDLAAQNASISPSLSDGAYRITLLWSNVPYDLDSHLTGPIENSTERFHLYYPMSEENGGHANEDKYTLDLDNTNIVAEPGVFETTTIIEQLEGVYRFSVHDYTNRGNANNTQLAQSNATVVVYKGNSNIPVATFHVPATARGTIWTVFELSGDTITRIDRIANGYSNDAELFSVDGEGVWDETVITEDVIEK